MQKQPDSSLLLLDSLGKREAHFSSHFRMQYQLSLTYAQAKVGKIFTTDSLTKVLTDYFGHNGTRGEKSLAYYLHGCALSDVGRTPEALQAYYDAIENADTTNGDFGYNVLKGIYGQMSRIFHKQNLPYDEIWALRHYIEYVRKTSSLEEYIVAKTQLTRPYFLLNEKDSALMIIEDAYQTLLLLGDKQNAASILPSSIYVYLERGQMSEARNVMEIFERDSGEIDKDGNISAGREGYYYLKGFFELASENIDDAEMNFRKAIQCGYLSEGYKGLLQIYREKSVMDSVVLFSTLYEAAQDSLHNRMRINAIHQMSALYNYSKSQKEAEIERNNARKTRFLATIIVLVAIIIIGSVFFIYWENSKKKKLKIHKLERDLHRAKHTREELLEELRQLKTQDYKSVIFAKEEKLKELTKIIGNLQSENEAYRESLRLGETDHLEQFLQSDIALLFIKKATEKTEKVLPTEAEWKILISQFSKDNPVTYRSFGFGKALSKLERRICILLVLDIPEYVIVIMTNSSASTISNSKARANEKLFGKKDAHPLKINLIHALKTSW
ncbi:MAG: hypothetical protein IJP70_09830 [Bacteroidales bacterium]|nr:hypothetical protein [Bacteroidales bacterium]